MTSPALNQAINDWESIYAGMKEDEVDFGNTS